MNQEEEIHVQEALPHPVSRLIENVDTIGDHRGSVLRHARLNMGYSLNDLAETTGLTVSEIENIESDGDERPEFVKRLATALGVAIDEL
jgi:ribosome-binding protein aMBF1 (putative translation factor)